MKYRSAPTHAARLAFVKNTLTRKLRRRRRRRRRRRDMNSRIHAQRLFLRELTSS